VSSKTPEVVRPGAGVTVADVADGPDEEGAVQQIARLTRELAEARATVNRFQQIFDVAPIGVVSYGSSGRVEYVNQRVLDATGALDAATFGALESRLVHPDDRHNLAAAVTACRAGGMGEFRMRVERTPGEWLHIEGSMVPVFHDGRLNGAVTLFRDVTQEVRQNDAVRWFKAIADVTTDIVGIMTPDGAIAYLNPAGQRFFARGGKSPETITDAFANVPPHFQQILMTEAYGAVQRGEVWHGDITLIRGSDERLCPMSAVVVGVRDDHGAAVSMAVTYRDLTDRIRLQDELRHAAAHDQLTGLASRRELFRSLEVGLATDSGTAVLFFDLDDFKVVNDSLGHAVGDEVLSTLALRIRRAARDTDLVGRLGGDEFLVICRGVSNANEAMDLAARILRAVGRPMTIAGRERLVTGSIGIALSAGRGETAATLIQEADIAMYRAKRAGRRQAVLFDESMRVEAVDRLELEGELRSALELGQFELLYQPLVYFGRNVVQNFEALIRWNHPRHGLLSPSEFLPAVEKLGLANAVGLWVFTTACKAVAAMRLVEPDTTVGVNVHPDQLRQPGFVDAVTRCMASARITGEALAIEITEHAMMIDVAQTRQVLEELQEIGVSIAIDDFGTGYSNLDLLRRLPVDYLKIDQSFVAGLGIQPGDTQLVRMIVGLSQELGIVVIAEGVETQLQADELQRLGCAIAQGYLYSKPLGFDDALAVLHEQGSPSVIPAV
jgi:diguanylate cyclase (GGDEF)-like protein/PAS domain S-box-containing protein